jgi:predicted signal transduction protein with EAL and GGDEF domain
MAKGLSTLPGERNARVESRGGVEASARLPARDNLSFAITGFIPSIQHDARMTWYESLMVLVGMGLLIASMKPIALILRMLEKGQLHRSWQFLRALIVVFIIGYGAVLVVQHGRPPELAGLIVSMILMAGGAFVLTVAQLSAWTTADIVRIARLEADVVRDPLTGAFNRRYMDTVLPVVVASARRTGRPLSALLVDLDHFKHVNDNYGHTVGDLVLKKVSSLLLESSRAGMR